MEPQHIMFEGPGAFLVLIIFCLGLWKGVEILINALQTLSTLI